MSSLIRTQAEKQPLCTYDAEDFEQITRAIGTVTLNPFLSVACYLIPFLGSYISGYLEVREGDIRYSSEERKSFLGELNHLKAAAGIKRKIALYSGSVYFFHNYGGSISITTPFISMPDHRLKRPNPSPPFGMGEPQPLSGEEQLVFTENETRFFLAREIGHVEHNDAILRVIVRITILAVGFFLYFSPFTFLISIGAFLAVSILYVFIERHIQAKMDLYAVQLLGKSLQQRGLGDETTAVKAAITALEKMRQWNKKRLHISNLTKYYVSEEGNNWLDILNPLLTRRIARLEQFQNARSLSSCAVERG